MASTTCFSRDELRNYLLGDLPEAASGAVALHVETCEDCEATVTELDRASDTLIKSLREPVAQVEPASAYRLAVKRVISSWQELVAGAAAEDPNKLRTDFPRLRDYELFEPLARGGMGTVYRARHLRLNRQVALKVLPGRLLKDPVVVARFEREMQAVGSLRHPAIVQATDGGEAEGVHFLVMELIDGCDANALIQLLGPLPVADACEIVWQAAIGMAYVHEQGTIHRDLKPSNLMVTHTGEVKVLDLGLARVVGEQLAEDELTTIGQLLGTLDYMAPEQIENSHTVDERTDVYSLGATLYKLLAGRTPHTSEAGEPLLSKLRRIAAEPPLPLHQRQPNMPTELCELVDRLLSKNPDDRPASMDLVAQSLETFCSSSDLAKQVKEAVARREKLDRSSAAMVPPSEFGQKTGAAATQAAPVQPARGKQVLGWIAACLCLFAAAAMGVVMTLQTTAGQLVIETATPDVEVRVMKAGQPYRQLTLKQQANSLRLGAGEYEVEIISDADGLEIENGRFTLKRGETWLARIVHRGDTNEVGRPTVNQPTYEGKTLAEWLALLRQERSAKQLYESCQALDKLVIGDDASEAVEALLTAVRVHSSYDSYQAASGSKLRLWDTVEQFLAKRDKTLVMEALTKELDRHEEANKRFILEFLSSHYVTRTSVSAGMLVHVEQLAADDDYFTRIQALSVLQKLGSEDAATRRLVAALSDRETDVALYAARRLIETQSNIPLVVATLRQIVRSGELHHRAEAAWRLGDLGVAAKSALPELTAIVQDADDEINRAAVYEVHSLSTSVKDAAIRALGEIGDPTAVSLLTFEWRCRTFDDSLATKSMSAWKNVAEKREARTYTPGWVADAIEQLIHLRPQHMSSPELGTVTVWEYRSLMFSNAYYVAFDARKDKSWTYALDAATQLLPRAQDFEIENARRVVESASTLPKPAELELEIKLIELLATADQLPLVLQSMIYRWSRYGVLGHEDPSRADQAAALQAYRECAVRLMLATKDWKTTLVPQLMRLAEGRHWPAGIVLLDILPKLDLEQQVDSVARVFQLIADHGNKYFATSPSQIATWLDDDSHRAAIQQQLEQATGDAWENLVVGLLQSGLADDAVNQMLTTRFGDDSINRDDILKKLVHALDDQPDLAQVVIDLLAHPALDAPTTVGRAHPSLRALYLNSLRDVPTQHRPSFLPWLQKLMQSGKNGEPEMAQNVLDKWK
jgi:HEAT repeat protein/tRNA A-37 threonylcarbamoyl transferase component Bud32